MNIYGKEVACHFCFYDNGSYFEGYVPTMFDLTRAAQADNWIERMSRITGVFYTAKAFTVVCAKRCNLLC